MGAVVKTVMTRRLYDLSGLAVGGEATVVVERVVDVTFGEQLELLVRVHDAAIEPGSRLEVIVRPIALTEEEPAVDFLVEKAEETSVTIDDGNDGKAPFLLLVRVPPPFGYQVQVQVRAKRLLGLAGCRATLSADLVCRD